MFQKLVTCKTCGRSIAKSANRCPYCGAQQHVAVWTVVTIIFLIGFFAILRVITSAPKTEKDLSSSPPQYAQYATSSKTDELSQTNASTESDMSDDDAVRKSTIIYEDTYVKISYNCVVIGTSGDIMSDYIIFDVENHTDVSITLALNSLALDGVSHTGVLDGWLGSGSVAPQSKGTVHILLNSRLETEHPASISGEISVLGNDGAPFDMIQYTFSNVDIR